MDARKLAGTVVLMSCVLSSTPTIASVVLGLDEGAGNVAINTAPGSSNGILLGGPVYSAETADNSPHSLRFDRMDDRIDLGAIDVGTTALTLAAWIRADSFPGGAKDPHIISKTSGNALSDHIFMLSTVKAGSGVRLRARLRTNGSTVQLRAGPGFDLLEEQWYHVAATYDGANLRLYLDGVEIASKPVSGEIDQDSMVPVSIGSRTNGGNYFHGLIDDVRILDQVLSAEDLIGIVTGVTANSPPVTNTDSFSTTEDALLMVNAQSGVLANDSDAENTTLAAELLFGPTNGQVELNGDGSFTYTPSADFFGSDSFSYRAFDGGAYSEATLVSIVVNGVNDNPVANDDNFQTQIEFAVSGNVLDNDTDPDGDQLQAALQSGVQWGDLTLESNGSFDYFPAAGFSGVDTFTYVAADTEGGQSSAAIVSILVNVPGPVDDPGALVTLLFEEGAGSVAVDTSGQENDGLLLGNPVYVGQTPNGSGFALELDGSADAIDLGNIDVSGSEITLAVWFKADAFPGRAQDPRLISKASGNAANDHVFMLSTISSGSGVRLRGRLRSEGVTRTLRAEPGYELDTNRWYHAAFTYDGDFIRLFLDGEVVGSQALSGLIDQDPALAVYAGAQPGGSHQFNGTLDDVRLLDQALNSAEILALMSETSSVDLPQGVPDSYAALEDQNLVIGEPEGVLGNDINPAEDGLTAALASQAFNGVVSLNPNGSFTYAPNADFSGEDSFTYQALNADGSSAPTLVLLSVESVNDAPVAVDDQYTTEFESALSANVADNDVDIDGDPLSVSLVTPPQNGLLDLQPDGEFVYTPTDGFSGQDQFSYAISDLASNPAIASVFVTVEENSPPPTDTDTLVQLSFDEGSGSTALDSSGAGNHGNLLGSASFDPETNNASSHSIRLNGAGDGVELGFLDVPGSQITMAAWVKADAFPGKARDPRIVSKASGNAASAHIFMLSTIAAGSETRLRARLKVNGSTRTVRANAGSSLLPGQWYHVAATYDGEIMRLYVNAEDVGSLGFSGTIDQNPGIAVMVGAQPGGSNGFDGLIDDFRLISRALTPAELQNIIDGVIDGNAVPIARDDSYSTSVDTPLEIAVSAGVLSNDTDADSTELMLRLESGVAHGDLVVEPDGSFDYVPDVGYSGVDSFRYRATDGEGFSNIATVVIQVNPGPVDQLPRFQTGSVMFTRQLIDTTVDQTHYAGGADLDGDRDIDIIATDYGNGAVYLYLNNGDESFTKTTLDSELEGAYPAHLGDTDGDQDIDILAGGYLSDLLVLYENDGLGNFTRQVVDGGADGIHSVVPVDLDQDGFIDLLTTEQDAGDIAWYENNGNGSYQRHVIDQNSNKAKRADFADLNGDGFIDVVAASDGVNRVAWYENDGAENFTRRIIDGNLTAAYFVYPVDINADGSTDIVAAGKLANRIVIYRNDATGSFTKQVIDTNARGARSVFAADLDSDGDIDTMGNSLQGDTISWYENLGQNIYSEHVVNTGADSAPYSVVAVDMDLSGQPDLLVAGRDDDSVGIYTNKRLHQFAVEQGGTLIFTPDMLRASDPDSSTADIIYRLSTAPESGELVINGVVLSVADHFTQSEVNQGLLSYVHSGLTNNTDDFELSAANEIMRTVPGAKALIEISVGN